MSARRRQDEHAADDPVQLVEPELEAGHDAEVAAAAADRPEQVGVRLGVHAQKLPSAVTTSAASRSSIVRPCLRTRKPTPPPSVSPPIPTEPVSPKRSRQAVLCGGFRVAAGGDAAAHPSRAALDVDLQPVQVAEVEHDAALGRAVARDAVGAAPDRELDSGLARECDHSRDVVGVGGADDRRGPAVDPSVEDRAAFVVAGLSRRHDTSVEICSELRNRYGSSRF